jgi:hypothetical protein
MQLQMETCDLDECDFLETRFTEYESEDEFLNDGNFTTSINGELKGVMLYFSTNDGKPHYIYKPLDMDINEFDAWYESIMVEKKDMCWIKNIYWKLEEVSCVLVLRNVKWFSDNIGQLQNIWNIIEKERVSGDYVCRAPNKRVKKEPDMLIVNKLDAYFDLGVNLTIEKPKTGCLIPLPQKKY